MYNTDSHTRNYILAAMLGAIGGGLAVIVLTRAIPKIVAGVMAEMMPKMMARMQEAGCAPADM